MARTIQHSRRYNSPLPTARALVSPALDSDDSSSSFSSPPPRSKCDRLAYLSADIQSNRSKSRRKREDSSEGEQAESEPRFIPAPKKAKQEGKILKDSTSKTDTFKPSTATSGTAKALAHLGKLEPATLLQLIQAAELKSGAKKDSSLESGEDVDMEKQRDNGRGEGANRARAEEEVGAVKGEKLSAALAESFAAALRTSIEQAGDLFGGVLAGLQQALSPLRAQEIKHQYEIWLSAEVKARKAAQMALTIRQDSQRANNEKMVATLNKIDKARKEKKQLVKDTKELILAKIAEYEKADEDVKNEMKKLEEKEQRTIDKYTDKKKIHHEVQETITRLIYR